MAYYDNMLPGYCIIIIYPTGRGNSNTYEKSEKDLENKTLLVNDSVSECDTIHEIGADFTTGQDFKSSPFLISTYIYLRDF